MRIVIALGGNALLKRGEAPSAEIQRKNVGAAVRALAPVATGHKVVISHGNGPQVGLLALRNDSPLDVLGAESEGMIGYWIEQELRSLLPLRDVATILTMVEVDPHDPGFLKPTKPIGPLYDEVQARRLERERGWTMGPDGPQFRRVVPSPVPERVLELDVIECLLSKGVIVICAGGGGIPTVVRENGRHEGIEAVIDKDRVSALLGRELEADLLVLATDVDAVYDGWGTEAARPIRRLTPDEASRYTFDAGSMGPKVEAAMTFAVETGRRAVIGAMSALEGLVEGTAGTIVELDSSDSTGEKKRAGKEMRQ